MMKFAAKPIISLHTVPYPFLIGTCILSIAIPSLCWFGWSIWLVALCVIAAWSPLIFYVAKFIYRKHGNLALIFILVVGQTGHFIEHLTVMVQLHLLRVPTTGIISPLNTEWVHFIWTSWVLVFATLFIFLFPKNMWIFRLFLFSIWHEMEHLAIMSVYLRTHIEGSPGLLAEGGAIHGGLPISRPDLHFLYV